jgi:hypothetical protein
MSRYSQFSAAISRGKAAVDRLETEFAQCRADPVKARQQLNQLRCAQSDLAWLIGQREKLTESAEG